jgi:hypothetical protein
MEANFAEPKIKGKAQMVRSICISNKTLMINGKWIRMAAVEDEDWIEGQAIDDPDLFVNELKKAKLKADIFTFAQKLPACKPRYKFKMEWDNAAAIPITTYKDWWENLVSSRRKDIKRAEKRGLLIKRVEFSDELIEGVVDINNETPVRQGKHFVHYGKDFQTVKTEYSTFLDRSDFIAAYFKDELVAILKMVYVGELACFLEILSKSKHNDKRPVNALISKAVEICVENQKSYLTYGKFYYGNKKESSFVDFKRRNGFEHIKYPRYYIPLTLKGLIAIKLKLQLGLLGILPGPLISMFVNLRSYLYLKKLTKSV